MSSLRDGLPADYGAWLMGLTDTIRQARLRASLAVNAELIELYWRRIGRDILDREGRGSWGSKVVERLAADLRAEFPDMRGLSRANLLYMRAFAEAWPDLAIVQRVVGQLPLGAKHRVAVQAQRPSGPPLVCRGNARTRLEPAGSGRPDRHRAARPPGAGRH